jgi:hypothetical protein
MRHDAQSLPGGAVQLKQFGAQIYARSGESLK